MNYILINLLLLCSLSNETNIKFEQIAFDYFFENIFEKEFPDEKSIQFSGLTEKERSYLFAYVGPCFEDVDKDFQINLANAAIEPNSMNKVVNVGAIKNKVKFKMKKNKGKLALNIYSSTSLDDSNYVLIMLKYKSGQSYFLFELSNEGEINRWCKTGIVY
jgi:hypothetical protein